MAKTITIPTAFGYPTADFFVEGIKYTYETGKAVSVDDKVAEIVANGAALDPKEGTPSQNVRYVVNAVVNSSSNVTIDKTYDEILEAFNGGKSVTCNVTDKSQKIASTELKYASTSLTYKASEYILIFDAHVDNGGVCYILSLGIAKSGSIYPTFLKLTTTMA